MDNSPPSSLERQIDSFLEHFKRSASKAMEAEWCSIGVSGTNSNSNTAATTTPAHENVMSPLQQQHLVQARHVTQDNSVASRPHPLMQKTKSRSSCLELNNMLEFNVNARQLRYFEKDHIRDMIPRTQLGVLAEFEYLIKQWKIQQGYLKTTTLEHEVDTAEYNEANMLMLRDSPILFSRGVQTDDNCNQSIGVNTLPIELPEFTAPSEVLSDEQQELFNVLTFHDEPMNMNCKSHEATNETKYQSEVSNFILETIIPAALARTKNNYKKKKLLTEGDRRLMAGSIVNFFESCHIKLIPHVMENLAEQITQQFPTESKKAWYDRHNSKGRGRLYMKYYNSHRSKNPLQHSNKKRKLLAKLDSNVNEPSLSASSNDADTNVSSLMEEIVAMDQDDGSKMVQCWLKSHKCEHFSEIMEMWQDTLLYRQLQLKYLNDMDGVKDFLENWPSYKLEKGYELLNLDFEHLQPNAMEIFRNRWMVFQHAIVALLEAEVKDSNCLNILDQYKTHKQKLNEDTNSCVLLYLLHAITKPYRVFKTATGSVRYCISDSQYSVTRLIQHHSEMDEYHDPYPCVFVLGDKLWDVRECYVCFLDIRYKLSFVDCLIACMQLFTLFKVEDPLPSLHFWQFIRGYLFDIHKEKERPYAIMENVIQYLETSAKKMLKKSKHKIEDEYASIIDRCRTDALVKSAGGLVLGVLVSVLLLKRRRWPIYFAMGFGLGSAYMGCERELRNLTCDCTIAFKEHSQD